MKATFYRSLMTGMAALAMTVVGAERAEAQSVYFQGYTNGCFNCTDAQLLGMETPSFQSSSAGWGAALQYNNAQFSGTTASGFLPMGAAANGVGAPQESNNFGAFYLKSSWQNYSNMTFKLLVRFISPMNSLQTFSSILAGNVQGASNGGVWIDFDNNTATFGSHGQYSVRLNDVSVMSPPSGATYSAVPITGVLTASNVAPEPVTMSLLGTGLLGLGAAARRRRREQDLGA